MRRRRGCPAADNGRRPVYQLVIIEGLDHEHGKVNAARDIALEDGVAHVPAPRGKALAFALLGAASAPDGDGGSTDLPIFRASSSSTTMAMSRSMNLFHCKEYAKIAAALSDSRIATP
jgi:hypothetical protein